MILGLLLAAQPMLARPAEEQREVEHRLALLVEEISALASELEDARELHSSEQAELRALDLEIQHSLHRLRELRAEESGHEERLKALEEEREAQLARLRERQDRFARQIEATYRLGKESRIKLLLNEDSPARVTRLLSYLDRINRAQAARLAELQAELDLLAGTATAIGEELLRIARVQSEHQRELTAQQEQRSTRQDLLLALATDIESRQGTLAEMQRDRADLERLLAKLANVLSDIPAELGSQMSVAEQRGRLPMPVSGRVLEAFGQKRAAGLSWQGWLIQAEPGHEVRNVAYGRVAFADWLRGYGLLMIIDHGQGFLSLYGYNESLLWEVGDWIDPGSVIATVGRSANNDQGLYFELRKDGQALDPAAWLKR